MPPPSKTPMRRGKQQGRAASAAATTPAGDDDNAADRQFVTALARGLAILAAFRRNDGALGNQEIAERTGIPPATVSRMTHTLTQLGYLYFDPRRETYDLGGSTLALGHTALARLNVRRVALPLMQALAEQVNANVGLGLRDRKAMLYAEACEGQGLVGLRLFAGSRIPIITSAMGRAYLAAVPAEEREQILAEAAPQHADDWPTLRRGVDVACEQIRKLGFCTSLGEWQKDIHGVAVPLVEPVSGTVYALNLGGPSYLLKEAALLDDLGPRLVQLRDRILARLEAGGRP